MDGSVPDGRLTPRRVFTGVFGAVSAVAYAAIALDYAANTGQADVVLAILGGGLLLAAVVVVPVLAERRRRETAT